MRISVLGSVSLHLFILFFTIVSLPLFNNDELEMPPVIQVELIEIAEKTLRNKACTSPEYRYN